MIDVPPLEDCSEFFTTTSSTPSFTSDRDHELSREKASVTETPISAEDNKGFAGMKKGFLNKEKTSKKKALDDIPFLKPSKAANSSNLRIPEVQEVLKTPSLLGSNGGSEL